MCILPLFALLLCVPQPAPSDPELAKGESNGCPLWLMSFGCHLLFESQQLSVSAVGTILARFGVLRMAARTVHHATGFPLRRRQKPLYLNAFLFQHSHERQLKL